MYLLDNCKILTEFRDIGLEISFAQEQVELQGTKKVVCLFPALSNHRHHWAAASDRWNPAVEQQAQDRIHRLGQYKPIHVTRFVIAGTIEERILKLQVTILPF